MLAKPLCTPRPSRTIPHKTRQPFQLTHKTATRPILPHIQTTEITLPTTSPPPTAKPNGVAAHHPWVIKDWRGLTVDTPATTPAKLSQTTMKPPKTTSRSKGTTKHTNTHTKRKSNPLTRTSNSRTLGRSNMPRVPRAPEPPKRTPPRAS